MNNQYCSTCCFLPAHPLSVPRTQAPKARHRSYKARVVLWTAYLDSSSGEDGQPLLGRQHLDEAQDEHLHGDGLHCGVQRQLISHFVGHAVHLSHAVQTNVDVSQRPAPCTPWDLCPCTHIRHCRHRTASSIKCHRVCYKLRIFSVWTLLDVTFYQTHDIWC